MSSRRSSRSRQAQAGDTTRAMAHGGSHAVHADYEDTMNPSQLARTALLFSYTAWFALVAAGTSSYEGEPVRVKSKDLPLHYFDVVFRSLGALLLFMHWAIRAAATYAWPSAFARKGNTVVKALLLYAALSGLRMAIYQLHVAGYIFTAKRWARDNLDHPPHIMSDHILLGASLMAGFACEAALSLLHLWHVRSHSGPGMFAKLYAVMSTVLGVLVSCECYFTARYFHPPHEIMIATVLGLVLFQAPLLWLVAHEMQQHAHLTRNKHAGGDEGSAAAST